MIDPTHDRLVFVRFKDRAIIELVVHNAAGAWSWFEADYCRRDQKIYLTMIEIGEPPEIPVCCHDDELAAFFWADPDLVPPGRVHILAGGPCARLLMLPAFLQGEQFIAWCEHLGYATEMVPCVFCQDVLPVDETTHEVTQQLCAHVGWCATCKMWSSPYYPGKETEMMHCLHRSADDLSPPD